MNKKRRMLFILISIICFTLMYFGGFNAIKNHLFYNLELLPAGEYLEEYHSPANDYTIKFFIHESSLSSPSIKGVLYNEQGNKIKTIYNEYPQHEVALEWLVNNDVSINGHEFNFIEETYDWRKEK